MPIIMRVICFANGNPCPIAGKYLKSFDHEAHNGLGDGVFTADIDRAMRFADHRAAFEFWQKTSTVRPMRNDGKPNRPLTATTAEFIEVPR